MKDTQKSNAGTGNATGNSIGGPAEAARIGEHVAAELAQRLAEPPEPGLSLVSTPIGNLGDITLRALATIARAGKLYCEDTRQSQKLLNRYGISRRLEIYHEHNAERERPRILAALEAGQSVALISDAGTPLVSDPGYKLVRAAIEAGHAVRAIPGANAPLAALVGAGLPTDAFHFAGFLPARVGQRRERIEQLAAVPGTLVLFETAPRLGEALAELATGLGPRQGVVARELTKLNEQYHRGTLAELARWATAAPVKGEIVLVIGPRDEVTVTDEAIAAALVPALAESSVRDAAALVAARLGVSRRRVYDLALAAKDSARAEATDDGSCHDDR